MADRAVLEQAGITATGMTETAGAIEESSSRSGTRLYMAPELLAGTVRLWDMATEQEPLTFKGHEGPVLSLTFTGDGKRLASGSLDTSAKVWDVETGRLVLTLDEHTPCEVRSVAFSPDATCLATASADGTAMLRSSFPWKEKQYPGTTDMPLDDRIELYKRSFWSERITAIRKPAPIARAKRLLDTSTYCPGTPIHVKLELTWNADASSVSVVETVPMGWTIAGASHGGKADANAIVWYVSPWTSPGVTLEYTATPPAGTGCLPVTFGSALIRCDSRSWGAIETTSLGRSGVWVFQRETFPQPTYVTCQDGYALVWLSNNNTGGVERLLEGDWVGGTGDHKKTSIRFDLSSVHRSLGEGGSTFPLARAELRLYAFGEAVSNWRNRRTIYAARLLKPWGEGQGSGFDGKAAHAGDLTFNSARHGIEAWERPGAMGLTDVADAESSATVGENYPEWVTLDVTESVRYFLANPDRNYGWKISQDPVRGVDDSTIKYVPGVYTYVSSNARQTHLRPMLVLVPAEMTNTE